MSGKVLWNGMERSLPSLTILASLWNLLAQPYIEGIYGLLIACAYFLGYQWILERRKDRVEKAELQVWERRYISLKDDIVRALSDTEQHRRAMDKSLLEVQAETKNRIEGLTKALNLAKMGL